jgi:hypothetical protein
MPTVLLRVVLPRNALSVALVFLSLYSLGPLLGGEQSVASSESLSEDVGPLYGRIFKTNIVPGNAGSNDGAHVLIDHLSLTMGTSPQRFASSTILRKRLIGYVKTKDAFIFLSRSPAQRTAQ